MNLARHSVFLVRLVCVAGALLWVVLFSRDPGLLERFELAVLDTEARIAPPARVSQKIVVAAMDERAVHRYGPLPWSPSRVAELVTALERFAPRVIALDMVFTGEREAQEGASSGARQAQRVLADALKRGGNVVLGNFFDFEAIPEAEDAPAAADLREHRVRQIRYLGKGAPGNASLPPAPSANGVHANLPELTGAARAVGHLNILPSRDGIVRWMPLLVSYRGDLYTAFAVEVALTYLGGMSPEVVLGRQRVEGVRLGSRQVSTDEHGRLLVRFAGPRGTYRTFSVADVLDARVPEMQLRDSIVLVGAAAPGVADVWATPLDPLLPGVEIHANAIDNLLQGSFLVKNWLTRLITYLLLAGLGVASAIVLPRARGLRFRRMGLVALGFVGLLGIGHYLVFTRTGYALGLVSPLLLTATLLGGTLAVNYVTEEKRRQEVERCFGFYLDRKVITQLLQRPERLRLGGERRELTVLFCDIRGFTGLAEGMAPEAVVEILNEFFTTMSGVVFSAGGLVDKFVGDQIMAFWGAPLEREDHALAACSAALRMMEEFRRLRARWVAAGPRAEGDGRRGRETMNCGIGINTGPMVVGNVGSQQRFSYTVIGDHVNVAARLEALNKTYGTEILVGPSTYAAAQKRLRFREIDEVQVRGRSHALAVYELLGRVDEPPLDADWLAAFAEGLAAHRREDWASAARAFTRARLRNPGDNCAEYFLARTEQFAQNPTPRGGEHGVYAR